MSKSFGASAVGDVKHNALMLVLDNGDIMTHSSKCGDGDNGVKFNEGSCVSELCTTFLTSAGITSYLVGH